MATTTTVNMLLLKLRDTLIAEMVTAISPSDLSYVDVVKLGLLQTDKLKKNIQLGVNAGDHEKPEEMDGIVTLEKLPNIGMDFYKQPREIGGGQIWMRQGVVQIECFFIRERLDEEEATEVAHIVMARLQKSIEKTPLTEIPRDSFGERPFGILHCYGSSFFESGGGGNKYMFRGKAHWACFTDKE